MKKPLQSIIKRIKLAVLFGFFLCFTISVHAKQWEWNQELYLQGDMTNVRTKPSMDAPIAAQMPLGMRLNFGKYSCEHQPLDWSCVCTPDIATKAQTSIYCGWIHDTLLSKNQPTSKQMQAWENKVHSASIASKTPKRKFIGMMRRMWKNDYFSLEAIAEYRNNTITLRQSNKQPYSNWHNKLKKLYLYSKNQNIGTAATAGQFFCNVRHCPLSTIASSNIQIPNQQTVIATNFNIPTKQHQKYQITPKDHQALKQFARKWIAEYKYTSKENKTLFKQKLSDPKFNTIHVAEAENGKKKLLISNWEIGSQDEEKYQDMPYIAYLVVLEKQSDNSYQKVQDASNSGCSYLNHLDINQDGTDEIFLFCEYLEGYRNYALIQKKKGKWTTTHGAEN